MTVRSASLPKFFAPEEAKRRLTMPPLSKKKVSAEEAEALQEFQSKLAELDATSGQIDATRARVQSLVPADEAEDMFEENTGVTQLPPKPGE